MKRDKFVGEGKLERNRDPQIQPKQRWNALSKHDFGNGPVAYYIIVAFRDPMDKFWICNYGWEGNNLMFNQHSMYVARLTTEEITQNFEFLDTPIPTPMPSLPITFPLQDPFQAPPAPWNDHIIFGNRQGTGDANWFQMNTTSDRTHDIHGSLAGPISETLPSPFNFANALI